MAENTHTMVVWNDRVIIIRYVPSESEGVSLAESYRYEMHEDPVVDPRWQVMPGCLLVKGAFELTTEMPSRPSAWHAHINATKRHSQNDD